MRLAVALISTALLLSLWVASEARGDRIYWSNYTGKALSFANLDGSGGGSHTGLTLDGPEGLAIDAAAGRIFWVDYNAETISSANLDGSGGQANLNVAGAPVSSPWGLAVDLPGGRVYWTNSSSPGGVSFANLNGSGGGTLNTAGATPANDTRGVAVDRAGGRVYWANYAAAKISFANLDGSGGGGDLNTSGATVMTPEGLAVDRAGGRVYWANRNDNTISFARLDGSGGGTLNTTGATVSGPLGIAIDPSAGRIYWANDSAGISFANLNGSGGGNLNIAGLAPGGANFLALLKSPSGAEAPAIAGTGNTLSCSQGSWQPDLPESFLYRAPQVFSYQWTRDGVGLAGATGSFLGAGQAGNYRCQVTAQNQAGSAPQTSQPFAYFTTGKPRFNRRTGTAKLPVTLPTSGTLLVTGKGVARQRSASRSGALVVKSAGTVKLLIAAKGKRRKKLHRTGRVKVKVTLAFQPDLGTSAAQAKTVKLKRKLRR